MIPGILCVVDNAISSWSHSNVCEMTLQSEANCAQSSKRWVGSCLLGPHNNPRYPVRVWQPQYPPTQPTFSFLVDLVTNNSCHHPCQLCVCEFSWLFWCVLGVCESLLVCLFLYVFVGLCLRTFCVCFRFVFCLMKRRGQKDIAYLKRML